MLSGEPTVFCVSIVLTGDAIQLCVLQDRGVEHIRHGIPWPSSPCLKCRKKARSAICHGKSGRTVPRVPTDRTKEGQQVEMV